MRGSPKDIRDIRVGSGAIHQDDIALPGVGIRAPQDRIQVVEVTKILCFCAVGHVDPDLCIAMAPCRSQVVTLLLRPALSAATLLGSSTTLGKDR